MQSITKNVLKLIRENFKQPIKSTSGKYSLIVDNIRVKQVDYLNTTLQDRLVKRGGTMADAILVDAKVLGPNRKIMGRKSGLTLVKVPVKSQRKSYIVGGSEWSVRKQPRLKQAPFVKRKSTKDNLVEGQINTAGGAYRIVFDAETLVLKLKVKTSHFNLYSVLRDLGVSDSDMRSSWGEDVFKVNAKRYKPDTLEKVHKILRPYAETPKDTKSAVKDFFGSKALDPKATKLTIGMAATKITPSVLLETAKKAINVADGKVKPDDTEDLAYKNLFDESDIIPQMIEKNWPTIERAIKRDLDRKQDPMRILSDKYFSKPIVGFFTSSELSGISEAFNPLSIMRADKQITIMGEGGLGSTYAVEDKMRAVHPSYMGVIDPMATPEGQKIGITNHLSLGARKVGNEFGLVMINAKTGKKVEMTKAELADKKLGFFKDFKINLEKPSRPKPKKSKVVIVHPGGEMKEGLPSEVQFIYPPHQYFYDAIGNSIPFIGNNCPNRVLMGTRHVAQSIALKEGDRPWVQSEFSEGKGFEDTVGKSLNVARVSGKVRSIRGAVISIKADKTGKVVKHHFHVKYPLSGSSFYDETPIVKVGDSVKAGDQLTSSPFNRDGKSLTIGKNLRVAFIPYDGWNFEDGIVISEAAAKKLTSLHKDEEEIMLGKNIKYGPKALAFYFPAAVDRLPLKKFGSDGLPKKGETFEYGEVLLPAVMLTELTPDMQYDRLAKKKGNKPIDISIKWRGTSIGKVVDVSRTAKFVRVYLESEAPMREGDKLCLTPDHDVLTKDGWKAIANIKSHDEVATLSATGELEYQRPQGIHVYNVDEKLYKLETQQLSMMTTNNHKMYVKRRNRENYELIPAKYMCGKRVRFKKDVEWVGEHKDVIRISGYLKKVGQGGVATKFTEAKEYAADDFLRMLGFVIGDGWVCKNTAGRNFKIAIAQVKEEQIIWIKGVLDRLNINYCSYGGKITFQSKQLWLWMQKIGRGALNKRIPKEVLGYSKENLRYLWEGLLRSDGSTCNSGSEMYYTSSSQLADDVQELALKAGWSANIQNRPPQVTWLERDKRWIVSDNDQYIVRIVKTKNSPQINHGHMHEQKAQIEKWEHYQGIVHCVTVPNHVFYVRRNGKPHWTGNSSRAGGKGIVTKILKDSIMPHTNDGKAVDILFNPAGIANRVNPGQKFEAVVGKIAKKIGKPIKIKNHQGDISTLDMVQALARKHGVDPSGEEMLHIPDHNVKYPALVGDMHFYKLTHVVSKKMHARGAGPGFAYTVEEQPARGNKASGQAAGALELYALLSGGARHVLDDISNILSQKNDDFWIAYQKGEPLPAPNTPHVLSRWVNYMRAAGVDLERNGAGFVATPLTDSKILKLSSGEIKNSRSVNDKLQPEKGGLFGPAITGGFGANKWNHIKLTDRIPNPLAKEALSSILGISDKVFTQIMKGDLYFDPKTNKMVKENTGYTQGKAFERMLSKINLDDAIKKATAEVESFTGAKRDKAIKQLRFLTGAKQNNKSLPDMFMMRYVPVLPTKFRPIYPNASGQLTVTDAVAGYRDVILINNQIKDLKELGVDQKNQEEFIKSLYDAVGGLIGTEDMLSQGTPYRGLLRVIKGKMNKTGMFQGRVISRRRDLSARSTIIVDPNLGIDEVGIPKRMAKELYKPMLVKQLNQYHGLKLTEARDLIDSEDNPDLLMRALEDVVDKIPVMLSRAPVLHKYGTIALKPKITREGLAIRMNPLVVQGLNADFDGDSCLGDIQLMLPVQQTRAPGLAKKYNDLPVIKMMKEELHASEYIPEKNIEDLLDVSNKKIPAWGTKIPTISIFSHKNGLFEPIKFVRDMKCREVSIKTYERREHLVSASHSLVVYDPEVDSFIKCKPADAHYKAVPIMLGYDGELRTLFGMGMEKETLFTAMAVLNGNIEDDCINFKSSSENLDKLEVILRENFKVSTRFCKRTLKSLKVTEKGFIKFFSIVFKDGKFPAQFWSTTREYRMYVFDYIYSLSICKAHRNKSSWKIKVSRSLEEIIRFFKSLGIRCSTYEEKDGRVTITLGASATPYICSSQLHPGWIPITKDEYDSIKSKAAKELKLYSYKLNLKTEALRTMDWDNVPASVIARYMAAVEGAYYFDIISTVKTTGRIVPMYDMTVPGAMTFAMSDGMVMFDTVAVSLPISDGARKEAFNKLMPSKMLFDAKRNYGEALANGPSKEYVLGIYLMTKPKKIGVVKRVSSEDLLMKLFLGGKLKINQKVMLKGKPSCAGQVLYKRIYPSGINIPLQPITKKILDSHLLEVAKNFKNKVAAVIDKVKDHGAYYVTHIGYSVNLNDLRTPVTARDKIIRDAEKKAKTVGFDVAFSEAKDLMLDLLKEMDNNNYVLSAIESGAFGRAGSIQRMILSPVAVLDHEDKVIPIPIRKSFAEGFSLPEYWLNIPGARAGLAKKGLSTADTGAFGKTILASVAGVTITQDDCGATSGITMSLKNSDVLDRVVANGKYRGRLVTTELQRNLIAKGVKELTVRSPLHCEANNGVCKKCFGILESGNYPERGYPIGALAGTTTAERVTQLALKAFHTGGAIGTQDLGWKRLSNIINTPKNIPRKAVLAELDGIVEKVDKQIGGHAVVVNGVKHFIAKELGMSAKVKIGEKVKAGDQLSTYGLIHPKELLDVTGDIGRVREQMMKDLDETYNLAGVKIKRKIFETLLVPLTKQVEITHVDPTVGMKHGIYPGALISANKAKALQKEDKTLEYKSKVLGLREAAHTTDDFVSELMSDELHKTMQNAPFIRKKAPITGHPISEFVWGTIGKDPDDRKAADQLLTKLEGVFGTISDMDLRG